MDCSCGSTSFDNDVCVDCGRKYDPPKPSEVKECPDCKTIRSSMTDRFCEVCRYDFVLKTSYVADDEVLDTPSDSSQDQNIEPLKDVPVAPISSSQNSKNTPIGNTDKVLLSVKYSKELAKKNDVDNSMIPSVPYDLVFHIDFQEHLIGRRSEKKGIFPDIPIPDSFITHRHAKIVRNGDEYLLHDLGSQNGTFWNGEEVMPGKPVRLMFGDVIEMGGYTIITVCKG